MTQTDPDFYEILHVRHDAPAEIIRASYRTLMQQLKQHPDLGGDAMTAARINEAYATLGNEKKRAEYDAARRAEASSADSTQEPSAAARPPRRPANPHKECIFCLRTHRHGSVFPADARCSRCNSPLALVKAERLEERDARAVARIQKRQAVELIVSWPPHETLSGRTEDISLSGMRLVTRVAFPVGQLIRVRSTQLEALARVANATARKRGDAIEYESGLAFVTLSFSRASGAFFSRQV